MRATRLAEPIVIDGRLEEPVYSRVKPVNGFIQQVNQLHHAAGAGLEWAAVFAVHGAKAHVLECHVVTHETGGASQAEHLLEVQCLT